MRFVSIVLFVCTVLLWCHPQATAQTYMGTQYCKMCHSSDAIGGTQYTQWSQTLHSKIHLVPDTVAVRPLAAFTNGDTISMGASYGNAKVILRRSGNDFFARVGEGGTEYRIAWTYGWGFKQRYLVKIDTSYYMLPIQYNLNKYLDNSSGSWATYNPSKWFNSDGSVKLFDNSFRKNSWDKNCMGCHVTGGKVDLVVSGSDTSWRATWANNSSADNIVVGCESCHGPSQGGAGAGHQMNPAKLTTKDRKMEVCGQCHNRASSNNGQGTVGTHEYAKNEVAGTYFNPADTLHPLSEFMNFNTPPNQTGGPGTWQDLVTARQHHQQYQEFLTSRHYDNPFEEVVCFTCHTPHSDSPNEHSVVNTLTEGIDTFAVQNDDNTLCLTCHATHGPFADIPKSWVHDPAGKKDSIGAVVNQHTKHMMYDPENLANTGGSGRCSKCHMTKTAVTAKAYDIHSHTFAVVSPKATLDYNGQVLSDMTGMLNSCAASCHRNPPTGSAIADFGIGTDANIKNWSEATDLALADTLWRYWQLWGFPTSVKEIQTSVPIAYSLSQNYPNPFNPSTKIIVDLPKGGIARLVVYNVVGQQIAILMNDQFTPGKYEVTWRGRDDFGVQVPSGIYFYRLESGAFTETKKMMLVK